MPQNTFQYREASTLFDYYSQALQQAEAKLQAQQRLDRVRSDLAKLCLGQTQMCSFAIGDREIVVNLLISYLQKVQKTATQVKIQGDRQAKRVY